MDQRDSAVAQLEKAEKCAKLLKKNLDCIQLDWQRRAAESAVSEWEAVRKGTA